MMSSVLNGILRHERFLPERHSFRHKHWMLLLDVDILGQPQKMPHLLSYNRWGIFSIQDSRFIDASDEPIKDKMGRLFMSTQESGEYQYLLIATPNVLGYSFNPASFYLQVNRSTEIVAAAIEVSNTSGESHTYVLGCRKDYPNGTVTFKQEKKFHVSPFIARYGEYRFEYSLDLSQISIRIDLSQEDECVMFATFEAGFADFDKWCLVRHFLPMLTSVLLTELRILRQAALLYLFRKKVPYFRKPRPLEGTKANLSPGFISKLKIPFK